MVSLYGVPAPAKINLFLHVVGRRDDGYHLLETVFRFVDLNDSFDFVRTDDGSINRVDFVKDNSFTGQNIQISHKYNSQHDQDDISPEQDLVVRAARLLQKTTNSKFGAKISYKKSIPMGGGLGGGSSDAATTLIALNRLWNTGLSRKDLLGLALQLGADVPIFVFGQAAFAQGIGEKLQAIPVKDKAYLLIKPTVKLSTKDVFSQHDLTRDSESVKISSFTDWQIKHNGFFGRNDLQATVFKLQPSLAKIWQALCDLGLNTRMTGSGSCLFAEFDDLSTAKMHQDQLISKIGLQSGMIEHSWVCQGLLNHPLKGWLDD